MTRPKRHHFLPQFYLKNFCKDGRLWLFDRERFEFRCQAPSDTAVRREYYTLVGPKGEKNVDVEEWLATIEGDAKPAIDALSSGRPIDAKARADLAALVALFITRTPEFRKTNQELMEVLVRGVNKFAMGTPEAARRTLEQVEREKGKKSEISPEELAEYVSSEKYSVQVQDFAHIRLMLSTFTEFATLFAGMNWLVLMAPPKASFVTSDNPVAKIPPPDFDPMGFRGYGLATPGATKLMSLSQSACLLMGDPGDLLQFRETTKKEVRLLNLTIADYVDEYLIARDRALVESIAKKARLTMTKRGRRVSG